MENDNVVDNSREVGYNKGNANDEFVDLVAMPPINDTECKHETLVAYPEDTLGDAIYHGCANDKCPVGFYIRPMQ